MTKAGERPVTRGGGNAKVPSQNESVTGPKTDTAASTIDYPLSKGPLPMEHHRTRQTRKAEVILRDAIIELHKLDLTTAEFLQVINRVMSESMATSLKYAIRYERHGDGDTPGDCE